MVIRRGTRRKRDEEPHINREKIGTADYVNDLEAAAVGIEDCQPAQGNGMVSKNCFFFQGVPLLSVSDWQDWYLVKFLVLYSYTQGCQWKLGLKSSVLKLREALEKTMQL